jgi:type II secretion system protein N
MASLPRIPISDRARRLLRVVLVFPLYFTCCLFSSAYETFPYDRVRDFATHQIEMAVPGSEVEIVSLEPAWITGVEATGVHIRFPLREGEEHRAELTIPRIYARAGILSYMLGTTDVTFEIDADGGGTIRGEIADTITGSGAEAHERTHVVANIAGLDLRRIGVIRHTLGIPVEAVIAGDIDVTIADELDETSGHITLTATGVALGDGRSQVSLASFMPGLPGGIVIDRLAGGDIDLRVDIEHGVGRVQQLHSAGEDAQLQGQGTVRFLRPIRMSALDLLLRIAIQPGYREREHMRGAFMLIDNVPQVAPYRAADGAFQIRLQGPVGGRITAMPAGTATMDH